MDRADSWLQWIGSRGWQLTGAGLGLYVVWVLFQKLTLLVLIIFISALLTALLLPVARWIEDHGPSRSVATALTVLGGVLLLGGIVALLGLRIAEQVPQLTSQFEEVRSNLTSWLQEGPVDLRASQVEQPLDQLASYAQSHVSMLATRAFGVVGILGGLVTAVILTFFLVRDAEQFTHWALTRLVAEEHRDTAAAAGARAWDSLRGYVQAAVVIGGLDGLLFGIALLVLGVPLAVPLAVLTFFGGFFPAVGAVVAGLLAAVVALVTGGWVEALIVVAVMIAVQQFDGNVLQPVIMGRAVHLHPVVVLTVLTAGGLLAGILGALLAVPLTAVLAAAGRELVDAGAIGPARE